MQAKLKGTNQEVIIYNFIQKSNGNVSCNYADCYLPDLDAREEILTSEIEIIE